MKERPILFSGPMVRAILAGSKTQTRRVVKGSLRLPAGTYKYYTDPVYRRGGMCVASSVIIAMQSMDWVTKETGKCPYGIPGDRLWVRETWAVDGDDQAVIFYRASDHEDCGQPWKPSIHMPRVASRIALEVIGVRIERVQDISREDIEAEGSKVTPLAYGDDGNPVGIQADFGLLWDQLNAKRGFAWGKNPWVWAITFRRI